MLRDDDTVFCADDYRPYDDYAVLGVTLAATESTLVTSQPIVNLRPPVRIDQ